MEALDIAINQLPPESRRIYQSEYNRRAKSTGVAYACWLFLGLHYFYLGRTGTQILYWLTLGGFGLWALFDLFRLAGVVRDVNRDAKSNALVVAKALAA